jgi:hypothetical protein
LRAITSAWFRSQPGQVPSAEFIALIHTLGGQLPEIGIGKVAFAQTIHYQPNYGKADKDDRAEAGYSTARHENHFAATDQPIFFRWSEDTLTSEQRMLLKQLLEHVSYFGRADSICEAELLDEGASIPSAVGWCEPCLGNDRKPQRRIDPQCRDVFSANPSDFSITDLWARRTPDLRADDPNVPLHLVSQMLATDMQVDGGCAVSYKMPANWPQQWVVRTPRTEKLANKRSPSDGPPVANYLRFSLQCRVPLQPKFTVTLAELFRKAAIHHLCKVYGDGTKSFAIIGKDKPERITGDHQHAFYLPMAHDDTQPGMLTDLYIWCPCGFTRAEVDVLLRIRQLNWGKGHYPANPVLIAMSKEPPDDVPVAAGQLKSRIWRSATPFVPPRHFYRGEKRNPKLKANALPEHQLAECLRATNVTTPVRIQRLPAFQHPSEISTSTGSFPPMPAWDIMRAPEGDELDDQPFENAVDVITHQNSSDSQDRPYHRRIGFFMQMSFDEPVTLPMPSFGHSSHFGLGLFIPAEQR